MGNEASQQVKYGEKLENDIKVSWKKWDCPTPFSGRECHAAAAVENELYIFGGVMPPAEDQDIESSELLVFNTDNSSWRCAEVSGDKPPACSAATLVAVGSKLYLFGGLSRHKGWFNDMYMYDTVSKIWSKLATTGTPPRPRDKLASAVIGDKIYIFGGFGPQGTESEEIEEEISDEDSDEEEEEGAQFGWFNDLFVFDTVSNTWSSPVQLNLGVPTPRAAHGMCAIGNHLVIFGGRDATARQNDLHIFNTETRKWEVDLMKAVNGLQPEPRSFHTVTAVENRVVVFGGRGTSNQHYSEVEIFDTKTREWLQPLSDGTIPAARGCHSSVVVNDHLVIFGGSSDFNPETMQCDQFYNDLYSLPLVHITSGKSIPKSSLENQENMPAKANVPNPKLEGLHVARDQNHSVANST